MEQGKRRLLMDRSVPGRIGASLPNLDVPRQKPLPSSDLREKLDLPQVTEGEVLRYFTNLSQLNFSVDTSFYPLGSCTMKYNPKWHDEVAQLPGFAAIHPLQTTQSVQGALSILHQLQTFLSEITGMAEAGLAPMAGAHGELAGMLITRAYHHSRGEKNRRTVLIPDSAHGTNPASAAMAGFNVVSIPSDVNGNMDLDTLRATVNENLAGLMITLPSTLGLFDTNIMEITRIVHESGGLVYGDGANMNALLGQVKLSDLGFDIIHLNLHKTFSTPHGGGGPGAGPICVTETLSSFLPTPLIEHTQSKDGESFSFVTPENSIGQLGGFHGNFGVLLRAYCYIRLLGEVGLRQVSKDAVLNANYIMQALKDAYHLPYDRNCMHEAVFSGKWQKAKGIRTLDISKRLIDHGIHPPTMYFPLIVDEALMIEPTETESKETLDYFVAVMHQIAQEAEENPEVLHNAPHFTPNTRLDEANAARHPDLRWEHPN